MSMWRTPTPYLFLGFAFMMGLIAVALLVLICTRRKPTTTARRGPEDLEASAARARLAPLDREEPKFVVIMAGDALPSFLASARPLATTARETPETGGAAAAAAAV
ncbi:hypothetical protein HU200_058928 [Digitaria exilis]|uniref:Uncharacterized protein n=1 Tax=Digitaria exilis TaxID=1010633 RepID=A0A835ABY9_9POAL|nr:hypothetical protein HU200_058928 [Digitaria exilis]